MNGVNSTKTLCAVKITGGNCNVSGKDAIDNSSLKRFVDSKPRQQTCDSGTSQEINPGTAKMS